MTADARLRGWLDSLWRMSKMRPLDNLPLRRSLVGNVTRLLRAYEAYREELCAEATTIELDELPQHGVVVRSGHLDVLWENIEKARARF